MRMTVWLVVTAPVVTSGTGRKRLETLGRFAIRPTLRGFDTVDFSYRRQAIGRCTNREAPFRKFAGNEIGGGKRQR